MYRTPSATVLAVIVLLPPSETKRPGGDGPPLQLGALSVPELTPLRTALVGELVALAADPEASRKALAISASQDSEIQRNAELLAAPTMPAIERYTGVLYNALDVGSLKGAAAARAHARLAVGSALFGLLRADDPDSGLSVVGVVETAGRRHAGQPVEARPGTGVGPTPPAGVDRGPAVRLV